MHSHSPARTEAASVFARAIRDFDRTKPVWILGHNDADGLAATALFARAFGQAGWAVRTRIVSRGESPWSDAMRTELASESAGGLIITDLGVKDALPKPGTPTVVVDHHVPGVPPPGARVITGHGQDPIPTSSLLAFWCAGALAEAESWLWLAAVGLIGDMADKAGFPEWKWHGGSA